MSAVDAYNLAQKETGKERLNSNPSNPGHQEAPDTSAPGTNHRVSDEAGVEGRGNDTTQNTELNRRQNPEPEVPDNNRETSNERDYSKDFEDLAAYRRQQGIPVAGSADGYITAAKLIMGDAEYYGMNAHGKQNEIKKFFCVNA